MGEEAKKTRVSQLTDKIADASFEGATDLGIEAVQLITSVFRNKLRKFIEELTTQADEKTKQEIQQEALALLQEEIDTHNRIIKLGEEKKEIDFMFAMKKLKYSEEQMNLLLDTAGRSCKPKDKITSDANDTDNEKH